MMQNIGTEPALTMLLFRTCAETSFKVLLDPFQQQRSRSKATLDYVCQGLDERVLCLSALATLFIPAIINLICVLINHNGIGHWVTH